MRGVYVQAPSVRRENIGDEAGGCYGSAVVLTAMSVRKTYPINKPIGCPIEISDPRSRIRYETRHKLCAAARIIRQLPARRVTDAWQATHADALFPMTATFCP